VSRSGELRKGKRNRYAHIRRSLLLFVTAWTVKDGRCQPHRDLGKTPFQPETSLPVQMLGLKEHGDLLSFCCKALTPGAIMLQLGTPEFQPFDGVFTGRRQGVQGSIWKDMPMPVVVVFRLTGIQEAIAACIFFRTGPDISLVLIAFPAAPVEVCILGQEVGAGMGPAPGAMVIDGAAGFTADEVFMRQAIGAAIVEILP